MGFPGAIVRLNPGENPPATALAEIYEPPIPGYSPRGMDIDGNGVVWAPLASGHLASFDGDNARCCLGQPQRASIARKVGRSILFPVRNSGMWLHRGLQKRAITAGSTSTTPLALAPTHPLPRAMLRIRCMPSSTASSSSFAFPIPWVSMPKALTAGSTTRREDGRAEASVDLCHKNALPHGRRQGDEAESREISAPARSAGAVNARPQGARVV